MNDFDKSDDEVFTPAPKRKRSTNTSDKKCRITEEITDVVFVMDNGAHTTKLGYSTEPSPKVLPNCIMKVKSERRRPFIGDQIEDCRDLSGLFYILPMQKGYVLNWDVQKPVWDYMLGRDCCNVRLSETPFVLTEPMFNFTSIQEATNEIFFEEYGIPALFKANPSDFAAYQYLNYTRRTNINNAYSTCMVVDSGFSFTHIIPYIDKKKIWPGIRRIDIGGKLLTNHLKEIISYRQLHVMDETYVINQVKEDTCYISNNFKKDMEIAMKRGPENTIARDYVLPDYSTIKRGYMKNVVEDIENDYQQILKLNNERFTVPEILFRPSDIGLTQMGIAEAVVDSINICDQRYRPYMIYNIVVGGGNVKFPGFTQRLPKEIKAMCPAEWDCYVNAPSDPVSFAWKAAAKLTKDPNFKNMLITRQEYEEKGNYYVEERFKNMVFDKPLRYEKPPSEEPMEDLPLPVDIPSKQQVESSCIFVKKESNSEKQHVTDVTNNLQQVSVATRSVKAINHEHLLDKELAIPLEKLPQKFIQNWENLMSTSSITKKFKFKKPVTSVNSTPQQIGIQKIIPSRLPAQNNSQTEAVDIKSKSVYIRTPDGFVVATQTPPTRFINVKPATSIRQIAPDGTATTSRTIILPSAAKKGVILGPRQTAVLSKPIILSNIRIQPPIPNLNQYIRTLHVQQKTFPIQQSLLIKNQPIEKQAEQTIIISPTVKPETQTISDVSQN